MLVPGVGPAQHEIMVENLMSKPFSTCLLVQDGSKSPEFVAAEVDLHPGGRFPASDHGKAILLAGGFASITPESGFPLSPTLQLNYDLASFADDDLSAIARAELKRSNAVNFRSYTVETDNRVCVIGDSVDKLETFIDTYGGVLDITPLLIKGFHPDIPTALDLHIDNKGKRCRLEYQLRSPIDFDLCTYCGACGPACPEQCISESLFVDYGLCTFCKECEKSCGAKAIDVHGALSTVVDVPALIILGGTALELPAKIRNVYSEDNLTDYFATLFPCQIDEVVTCDSGLCQYSGNQRRGCDLCLSSCPHGAITLDAKGVKVDSFKCEECGACVASCPTGALQNERFNDASFVDYFREVALPPDATVVIGDERALQNLWWRQQEKRYQSIFFLQYSTVHSLSLFHFMYLLSRGARRIVVLQNDNAQGGTAASRRQLDLANEMLNRLFDVEDAVSVWRVQDFDALATLAPAGTFNCPPVKDRFINRRQSLATALEVLVTSSGREITMQPEGYIPFATVSCNTERCTQCMACLNDCRIAAMSANQQQLTLNHLGALCVGCGLCVHICPENALDISSEFTLNSDFFTPVELARAEPMACKRCGKVFGTRKAFDRVMAILSKKEPVDISHFEYCETCRVVKLFETE